MRDTILGIIMGLGLAAFVYDGACEAYTNGNCFIGFPKPFPTHAEVK